MVSSVSGIGSFAASIFEMQMQMQSSSETAQTTSGQSFDELVGNGKISAQEESSSTGVTSMGGAEESSSSSSSSSSSNSEMDLNHDGQVTSDEVIRYMQMQMMDKMAEQTSTEDGGAEMNQQSQDAMGIEDFKNQQAAKAYASTEKLMGQVTDMIVGCFMA